MVNIKDFSSECYKTDFRWSNEEKKQIDTIKKQYGFKKDFDLENHLIGALQNIKDFKDMDRMTASSNEQKALIKNLKKVLNTITKKLEKISSFDGILNFKKTLKKTDYITRSNIIHTTECPDAFLDMTATTDNLIRKHDELQDHILEFIKKKEILCKSLDKVQTEKAKMGRKKNNFIIAVIQRFISIYEHGTNMDAKVSYYESKKSDYTYTGKFYHFLIKTYALLSAKANLGKFEDTTLGQYAHELTSQE